MANRHEGRSCGGWQAHLFGLLLAAIPVVDAQTEAGLPCGAGGARCSAAQWCNATLGECHSCYSCGVGQECLVRLGCRKCTVGTIDHDTDPTTHCVACPGGKAPAESATECVDQTDWVAEIEALPDWVVDASTSAATMIVMVYGARVLDYFCLVVCCVCCCKCNRGEDAEDTHTHGSKPSERCSNFQRICRCYRCCSDYAPLEKETLERGTSANEATILLEKYLVTMGLLRTRARERAESLVNSGYTTTAEFDKLTEEELKERGAFQPGDWAKVAAFRQRPKEESCGEDSLRETDLDVSVDEAVVDWQSAFLSARSVARAQLEGIQAVSIHGLPNSVCELQFNDIYRFDDAYVDGLPVFESAQGMHLYASSAPGEMRWLLNAEFSAGDSTDSCFAFVNTIAGSLPRQADCTYDNGSKWVPTKVELNLLRTEVEMDAAVAKLAARHPLGKVVWVRDDWDMPLMRGVVESHDASGTPLVRATAGRVKYMRVDDASDSLVDVEKWSEDESKAPRSWQTVLDHAPGYAMDRLLSPGTCWSEAMDYSRHLNNGGCSSNRYILRAYAVLLSAWGLFRHLLQPVLYFYVFFDAWPTLEPIQSFFGGAVAVRETIYALTTLACAVVNPGFLLIDVRASVDSEADGETGGKEFLVVYVLAPEMIVLWALFRQGGLDISQGKHNIVYFAIMLLNLCGLGALGAGIGTGNLTMGLAIGYSVTALAALCATWMLFYVEWWKHKYEKSRWVLICLAMLCTAGPLVWTWLSRQ
eukprot:COSAG04_NODE_739_length_10697_cov_6.459332_2_plen_759_part_00